MPTISTNHTLVVMFPVVERHRASCRMAVSKGPLKLFISLSNDRVFGDLEDQYRLGRRVYLSEFT